MQSKFDGNRLLSSNVHPIIDVFERLFRGYVDYSGGGVGMGVGVACSFINEKTCLNMQGVRTSVTYSRY